MRNSGLDAVGVKTGIVAPPPTTVVPVDCGMLCCCRRNNLEMPVKKDSNYLGTGTGIVFVLLGRRTSDGKPGVSGRGTRHELLSWYPLAIIVTPCLSLPLCRKEYICYLIISRNQHNGVKTRACSIGKPIRRDTGVAPRVTSQLASTAGYAPEM